MNTRFEFVTSLPDPPAFEAMIREYWHYMAARLVEAGGPVLSADDLTADTMAHLEYMAPPQGRLLLATSPAGDLLGCGVIRHIRDDAAEFKRMYVRPAARGLGLGRALFEHRVDEARRMGCRTLYADTIKGNMAMISMYEKLGFTRIPRYPENANPPQMDPFLVYFRRDRDPVPAA